MGFTTFFDHGFNIKHRSGLRVVLGLEMELDQGVIRVLECGLGWDLVYNT